MPLSLPNVPYLFPTPQLMMLFNQHSPPRPADPVHLGAQADSVPASGDKADGRIRAVIPDFTIPGKKAIKK